MLNVLVVFVVIIFSMTLHEIAHGYAAYFLGDTTAKDEGRLSLNPLVHLDPWTSVALPLLLYIMGGPVFGGARPVPVDSRRLKWGEWGMALLALAGPAMNLLLAFAGFLIGHFSGMLYEGGLLGLFFVEMVLANLGFAVFNLLPIPPLDGSRVLYALAPDGVRRVMMQMEQTLGILVVFALVMVFGTALGNFTSGVMDGILEAFYWVVGVR